MGWLSWALLSLLVIAGLGIGAGSVFFLTLPKDFLRDEIVAQVSAKTGRELAIAGPATFSLYPSIGVSLADVSLSAPPGMDDRPLVKMASLDVSIRLLPLLRREVAIERLVLRQPIFELHVDGNGRRTWDMAVAIDRAPKAIRLAQTSGTASDAIDGHPAAASQGRSAAGNLAALEQLQLGDVRIEGGTLHYSDARTGVRHDLTEIGLRLALKSLSTPLDAKGGLVWRAQKIDIDGKLTSPKALIEERPVRLALTIASTPLSGSYSGTLLLKGPIEADGAVTASTGSVKDLAKWVGTELPPVAGLGPLEAKGQLRAAGSTITLADARLSLDGATATGQVSVDTAGERPLIKGNLSLSELDLNKYIGREGAQSASQTPGGGASTEKDREKNRKETSRSIEELLSDPSASAPGPKVKGFAQRAGWSEGPIDASALALVDADARLTVSRLLYKDIKVGQSKLSVALKSRVLKSTFDEVQLYDGHGQGFITFDASDPQAPAIGGNVTLDAISVGPLLKDAAAMDWLSGKGKLTLAISGQGQSQRRIVETLNGKAALAVSSGAIVGWNIPGMVGGLSQGKLSGLDPRPTEKTEFSELSSTWTITNGLAENQDLRLTSPLLRATGAGSVMLPPREVDYTLRPTLVAGTNPGASALEVPVRIHGSWDKPKFTPDVGGVLKDPNKAADVVKELGKKFKGKSADEIVKGLLGGGD